jgi:hypothetical protein
MTSKNYGPGASGYLDPEGRSWETTVYQASKPILDKELNLIQDAEQDALLKLQRRSFPSGWVSDDFLNTTTSGLFVGPITTANTLSMSALWAHVNGWLVRVTNTNDNTGLNLLSLGASPAGVAAKRTDLVILEVWRRLIPASPATTGKSPAGRIWREGNVKVASGDDVTLNFADDILDGAVGAETTKRVQIQYRLRVVNGIDLFTYAFGIDDPTVVAHSVPAAAAAPDGVATVYTYANQSAAGDSGLWVAGNGNPANTLGTVDGYMYALPLAAIFRRNTSAFARNTNHNGGVAYPGPSDRPDGFFYDIIEEHDILDLRRGVAPTGWDLREVLEKNSNFLLDNVNQTEISQTVSGGGLDGHTVLWADEIGVSNANGGDGTTTGDTPGAEFVGEFDAVRRSFSDKCIYETMVLTFVPTDGSGGGPNWVAGDTITVSPSALRVYPYPSFNWASFAPSTAYIVSVDLVRFVGNTAGQITTDCAAYSISGIGTVPQGSLAIRIQDTTGITSQTLHVRLTVAYPTGVGLSKTPVQILGDNATVPTVQGVYINNPGQLPAASPILYSSLDTPTFTTANREVRLTYKTLSHTFTLYTNDGSNPTTRIVLPERAVTGTVSISVDGSPYGGVITVSNDGYTLSLAPGIVVGSHKIDVTLQTTRPLPANNEQLTIYYATTLSQTVREFLLGTSLQVTPKLVSQNILVLTAGSGSDGAAYPFPSQYVQPGGVYPGSGGSFTGDHELDGDLRVSITTLFTDTGFMQMTSHVPVVPSPDAFVLGRAPGDSDIEGRTYFKQVTSPYKPLAVGPTLSDPKKHKNLLPMLCELTADTLFGHKGQLVLVFLSRWASFDDTNSIAFLSNLVDNTTTASVYRLKGNLLSNRRS